MPPVWKVRGPDQAPNFRDFTKGEGRRMVDPRLARVGVAAMFQNPSFSVHAHGCTEALRLCVLRVHRDVIRIDFRESQFHALG
jgi:hypothetical protein